MKILTVRNVHEALPRGIRLLQAEGIRRESRNGPVLVYPGPVTTVYQRPEERVLFWSERDANPFFHLYESLWMLAGRNDLAPLVKYAKNMADYSDDGKTLHGAYGYRWREHFRYHPMDEPDDQLKTIASRLYNDPDDRRCVLQMWDTRSDLGANRKDVPCNVTATFQMSARNHLDLCIFCRSNDIIWGAYGANAVHFSMLQEYMAHWIGVPIGTMYQVSVNWHAYVNKFGEMSSLANKIGVAGYIQNPYEGSGRIETTIQLDPTRSYLDIPILRPTRIEGYIKDVDETIATLLQQADSDTLHDPYDFKTHYGVTWAIMLAAHQLYRQTKLDGSHYHAALGMLLHGDQSCDWIVAGQDWMLRRLHAFEKRDRIM